MWLQGPAADNIHVNTYGVSATLLTGIMIQFIIGCFI